MAFAIAPPPQPCVPVQGGDPYPVRRIYCVGRNYAAHAREMGHDPDREPPFFFMKPADAVAMDGSTLPYPPATSDLHHEIELVVALAKGGANIAEDQALEHVFGYTVGLDMTQRDLQGEAKEKGRPWDTGKGFDQSAPIGALRTVADVGHPTDARIWVTVNGESRQDGNINQMIWNVPETIAYLSGLFHLQAGDLIFTGTPAGVGAVGPGDRLEGAVEGIATLSVSYGPKS
ncbi:MAG: fumarylacetoacetate hydrolase family protein [Alphaproteobacteria bacterium]|nr:fumarylacetoacetate hydrolase family protein [Alphaproteobacteria bacterium]